MDDVFMDVVFTQNLVCLMEDVDDHVDFLGSLAVFYIVVVKLERICIEYDWKGYVQNLVENEPNILSILYRKPSSKALGKYIVLYV